MYFVNKNVVETFTMYQCWSYSANPFKNQSLSFNVMTIPCFIIGIQYIISNYNNNIIGNATGKNGKRTVLLRLSSYLPM